MTDRDEITLTQDDAGWAVRLLADALAPDDDRDAARRRLLDGLGHRIASDGWVWWRSRIPLNAQPVNLDFLYGGGLRGGQLACVSERMLRALGVGCEHDWFDEQVARGAFFTATRPQMVDDAAWQRDPTLARVRAAGLDEVLYSWVPLPDGQRGTVWSGACFFRALDRPAFDPGAGRLVHLVMSECGRLHADGVNLTVEPALTRLTPKQRLVLMQLLDGRRVPEAAAQIGLSVHTVNDHIKAIYRHFEVQSRAELMSRFVESDDGDAA